MFESKGDVPSDGQIVKRLRCRLHNAIAGKEPVQSVVSKSTIGPGGIAVISDYPSSTEELDV